MFTALVRNTRHTLQKFAFRDVTSKAADGCRHHFDITSNCSAAADWSRNYVAYLGCSNVNYRILRIVVPVVWSDWATYLAQGFYWSIPVMNKPKPIRVICRQLDFSQVGVSSTWGDSQCHNKLPLKFQVKKSGFSVYLLLGHNTLALRGRLCLPEKSSQIHLSNLSFTLSAIWYCTELWRGRGG